MFALLQGQWCPMCGGSGGWGMMALMMLFWLVVIAVVVGLVYKMIGRSRASGSAPSDRSEDILRERYARGEIDRETHERMLEDLRRGSGS